MNRELKISPEVYDNLREIKEYISKDNPVAAKKVVDEILDEIEKLKYRASIGTSLANRVRRKTRLKFILVHKYIVIFELNPETVEVVLVVHSARKLEALKLWNTQD